MGTNEMAERLFLLHQIISGTVESSVNPEENTGIPIGTAGKPVIKSC